ncbi:hypothetical protein CsSME_00012420 [Camellia sinensis var. sinensis]
MSVSPEQSLRPSSRRRVSWPDSWVKDQALRHVVFKMRRHSLSETPPPELFETIIEDLDLESSFIDFTSLLSDELLLLVLSKLPESQHIPDSAVCKRWSRLSGRLVHSIKLLDWEFLESGRLLYRFPNLTDIDLVRSCGFMQKHDLLDSGVIDRGVRILAQGCPNLRRLVIIGASAQGLSCVAEECLTLQELELHCCPDSSLSGIFGCQNLQILKLIGFVDGFYDSVISDIGLTIVAQGCKRLVKLELVGCEGSYDGIKAIGQCCQMLEELTLCDHRMDGGWLAALSYCMNLKTLKLKSCKNIDLSPGPHEHLGSCPALEELHLQRCQMRDKQGMRALFLVCEAVRELIFKDCFGLENNVFGIASICREIVGVFCYGEGAVMEEGGGGKGVVHPHGRGLWKGIWLGWTEFWDRTRIKVGVGDRIHFWQDRWCSEVPLVSIFPMVYAIAADGEELVESGRVRQGRVRFLSLEGCSLLTMEGLDAVVLSWKELQRLKVVSCNNIKDSEITPAMASLFSVLKALKWQPDSRSLLASGLEGTGLGMKGGRSFKGV